MNNKFVENYIILSYLSNADTTYHYCYSFVLNICHAYAMPMLCLCYAYAMPMLCLCYANAMPMHTRLHTPI